MGAFPSFFAVEAQVSLPVCPVRFSAHFAGGFPKQILVFSRRPVVINVSFGEADCLAVAKRGARCAAKRTGSASAFNWIGNDCFSVLEHEDSVGTKLDTSGFSCFRAAVAFVGINCWEPRVTGVSQLFRLLFSMVWLRLGCFSAVAELFCGSPLLTGALLRGRGRCLGSPYIIQHIGLGSSRQTFSCPLSLQVRTRPCGSSPRIFRNWHISRSLLLVPRGFCFEGRHGMILQTFFSPVPNSCYAVQK